MSRRFGNWEALWFLVLVSGAGCVSPAPLQADEWGWHYRGPAVVASGRLTTVPVPGPTGETVHQIVRISGSRNGVVIDSLQSTGTAIPGNAPYRVDNRLGSTEPRLTASGFGYALADGTSANPFFQTHSVPHGYREYFSRAPFLDGTLGPEDAETPVEFVVSRWEMTTPWREVGLLAALGWGLAWISRLRGRPVAR